MKSDLISSPIFKRSATLVALLFIGWNVYFLLGLRQEQVQLESNAKNLVELSRLNTTIYHIIETINYPACRNYGIAREAVWITYFPEFEKFSASRLSQGLHGEDSILLDQLFDQVYRANTENGLAVEALLHGFSADSSIQLQNHLLSESLHLLANLSDHLGEHQQTNSLLLAKKWENFSLLLIIWFLLAVLLTAILSKYIHLLGRTREIEGSLTTSESELRMFFENSAQHFILLDRELRVVKCNSLVQEFLHSNGMRQLPVGGKLDHFYPIGVQLRDLRHFERRLQSALRGESMEFEEMLLLRKDGEAWFHFEITPVHVNTTTVEGICLTALNVTANKRAEQLLIKSEERFRSLVKYSSDLVSILNADGTFTYTSSSVKNILEYYPEQLIGKNILEYLHAEDLEIITNGIKKLLPQKNAVATMELRFAKPDGSYVILECVTHNLLHVEGIEGLVVNARDVTNRVQLEQQLIHAKDVAEEMNRLKSSFLANMSHEIRTPLTAVLGFAEVLSDAVDKEEHREFARSILRGGNRLLNTINSVLDLAKIEANKLELHPTELDLVQEIENTILLLRPLADDRELSLEFCTAVPSLPITIDQQCLSQILNNLIGNGIKFTAEGGVKIGLACDLDNITLEVADTGIGMAKDFLPYVFDEFRQESRGFNRSFEGTGLGLAISNKLVHLLGGTLTVTSELGHGSTFTITFPCSVLHATGVMTEHNTTKAMQLAA